MEASFKLTFTDEAKNVRTKSNCGKKIHSMHWTYTEMFHGFVKIKQNLRLNNVTDSK